MVKVKICGNQSRDDLAASVGADIVGFIVGAPRSRRNLSPSKAEALIREAPPSTETALVTPSSDVEAILEMVERAEPDILQVHSELPLQKIQAIRGKLPRNIRLFALLSIADNVNIEDLLLRASALREAAVDAILLDSRRGSNSGGTGIPHDWTLSRRIVQSLGPFPVILAGGLAPENVRQSIQTVDPFAVDVATGVEDEAGAKSSVKIQQFLRAVAEGAQDREGEGHDRTKD